MKKNIVGNIVFIILIILFVLLVNFRFYVFNSDFYEREFEKIGVYEEFPKDVALENTETLLNFLRGKGELESDFFNKKEKMHMEDVKKIIRGVLVTFYVVSVLLLIFLIKNRRKLGNVFMISGGILILLLLMFSMFDFRFLFTLFHKVSFSNNLWLLNPKEDNLINLFPLEFFQDFGKRIGINSFVISVLLVCSGFFFRKSEKNL